MTERTKPVERDHESRARLDRLQSLVAERSFDFCALFDDVSLLYYTGSIQSGVLVVPPQGPPTYFVRRSAERARAESWLADRVVPMRSYRTVAEAVPHGGPVAIPLGAMPAAQLELFRRYFPDGLDVRDVTADVTGLRSVKGPAELALQREAGRRQARVFAGVAEWLDEGVTEWDLGSRIRCAGFAERDPGVTRLSTPSATFTAGVVCFGDSSLAPGCFDGPCTGRGLTAAWPIIGSERPIRRGEHALVDFVFGHEGYFVDCTRIFALGSLHDDLRRAHDACLAVQAAVVAGLRPGAVPADLYALAVDTAARQGWGDGFMGLGDGAVRFVGHGIGMVVDELPVLAPKSDRPLQAGMVVAVEPKVAVAGLGMVGIENTWHVTAGEAERLTPFPDGPFVL